MKTFDEILKRVKEKYKTPKIELNFKNPFELLVSLILSARCRDSLTNKITEEFFKKYPNPQTVISSDIDSINTMISSCSMHNTKAKNLYKLSKILCENYNCTVPDDFKELIKLPGVAEKTANMLLSFGFHKPAIGVDTHILRVANRLGITDSDKPKRVQKDIENICPKQDWIIFSSGLILIGRYICKAKKPNCLKCFLNDICPKKGVK